MALDVRTLSRRKKALFATVAVVLGTLAGLALVEVGLRGRAWLRARQQRPPESDQVCVSLYRPSIWSLEIGGRIQIAHAQLKSFCREFATGSKHNSHGFRSPEYTVAHPPGTFRLSVIGDSYTWGQGVRFEDVFTSVLPIEHKRSCPDSGAALEVLNHGTAGSTLIDNVVRLRAHVEALRPDLVLVQFTPNDIFFRRAVEGFPRLTGRDLSYRWHERLPPINGYLGATLPLEDWTFLEFRRAYARDSPEWGLLLAALDYLRDWSGRTGTPVYFLIFPLMPQEPWPGRYTEANAEFADQLDRVAAEIRERGFGVLDLTDTYNERARGRDLKVSASDAHPGAHAHRLAAEALYEALLEEGPLACPLAEGRSGDPRWRQERRLRNRADDQWDSFNRSSERQLELYEGLQRIHPENLWTEEQIAFVQRRLGRLAISRELYEQVAEAGGDLMRPWVYYRRDAVQDEGREYPERLLEWVPDHPPALERLARSKLTSGHRQQGCEHLGHLVNQAGYLDQLKRALAWNREHRCGEPRPVFDPVYGGTILLGDNGSGLGGN